MPLVGFETPISADERPQTYALYRSATGTGTKMSIHFNIIIKNPNFYISLIIYIP
jgi:hypothetical protein